MDLVPVTSTGSAKDGMKYGERLLPQLIDEKARTHPDDVVGMMAKSEDISAGFSTLSYSQLSNAISFTAHWIDAKLGSNNEVNEPICFIGIQDFRYWVMELAAMKTGHPILIPSTRNAVSNTVSLLNATKCSKLFYAGPLAAHAQKIADATPDGLGTFEIPDLEFMVHQVTDHYSYTKTWEEAKRDTAMIVHTSGSTGAPKPIYYNHIHLNRPDRDHLVEPVRGRISADTTLLGKSKLTFIGTPFFHLSGISFSVAVFFRGSIAVIGPPMLTGSGKIIGDIIKALHDIHGIVLVPSLCDTVFIDYGSELLPYMKELFHVCWLGGSIYIGPIAQATGDFITSHTSAHLWQIMASTETHLHPYLIPPSQNWMHLLFHPTLGPTAELLPGASTADGRQLYEIVQNRKADSDPGRAFQVVFDIFPELQQWRSRDLVTRLELDGDVLYNFQGRLDDILILRTGLKVNPVDLEVMVSGHPLLSGCLVFGSDKPKCGLLVEPKSKDVPSEDLIEKVWRYVVDANATLPEHARVERNMILIVAPMSFPRAGKGSIVRSLTYQVYNREIQALYL
ncbi:hypothetical protein OIDMADRAFT_133809 [Oidiodendron maius Zn]|uniref:AMP-dependent synthetase/ligase domain-containing protein n=1 Tax=Oidiodendron maius (strain Zn) TaxID=913774 RepID=A0A0C3GI66_OIDMZ|nr:hypothetical protein OIDMADRAFT_133809 [Oidiodendron maius Zn]